MKGTKSLSLFAVFLLSLASLVMAAQSTDYDITNIIVNGINVFDGTSYKVLYVERGDILDLTVELDGAGDQSDVRVKAWIEGYEYDDIEDKSEMFDVENGTTYSKDLVLEIPDDLDASESEDYTLHISAVDKYNYDEEEITLKVKEARHKLNIQDVIFRSGTSLEAGKTLFASVWVENVGSKDEENIDVKLSIPALGISTRDKIDELVTEGNDDDEDEDTVSIDLALSIPSGTKSGEYDVIVSVEYNKGHSIERNVYELSVEGEAVQVKPDVEAIISIDTTAQTIAPGEGAVYKVMFANLDSESKTFSLEVVGSGTWASSRVDPSFLTVKPGESGEMYVYVSAFEGVPTGKRMFTVRVKSEGDVIKEINLESDVTKSAGMSQTTWDQVRKGLEIGFAVLLVILVILGIILAASKFRGEKGITEEEPSAGEGQTYYYYPHY